MRVDWVTMTKINTASKLKVSMIKQQINLDNKLLIELNCMNQVRTQEIHNKIMNWERIGNKRRKAVINSIVFYDLTAFK